MQKTFILFFIFLNSVIYSQKSELNNICKSNDEKSFFSLENDFKKVVWRETFYVERRKEVKNINGKNYLEIVQESENDGTVSRYFREENGTIYELDKSSKKELVRFDTKFEKGYSWKTGNGKDEYTILSFNGELETPFCIYKNLLVIDAKMNFGHFTFYYSRGLGYVGATENGKVISYITSML